ncbi:MAG: hypothetical protein QMD85_03750 [Candidatus Aenigmarchaeota archaeon]|nr:hypothetical protein [Candidatus Aenigmarchaeota archaeon]
MENLKIYNAVKAVPIEAQKAITGGRLKGMTDINPMWRIKALTEQFGPVGIGWKYEITEKRLEQGASDEIAAFVDINLYIKYGGEWSEPIPGTGGSMLVTKESRGLHTSDECFKMALTDAISVSCKALGFGADVYWDKDRTKYTGQPEQAEKPQSKPQQNGGTKCAECDEELKPAVKTYSEKTYGRPLCLPCQGKAKGA